MTPAAEQDQPRCNICGSDSFRPGPNGRLSQGGQPPACCGCGSLERHRIFRSIFDAIRTPDYASMRCLQFSIDPSIDPAWFHEHETTLYGIRNSLDVQAIDRPDACYDLVVCNHIIEHVPDDRAAVRELVRIVRPDGMLFLTFPLMREVTVDWGYPDPKLHGHYRVYGRNVVDLFREEVPHAHVIALVGHDPATDTRDFASILTQSDAVAAHVQEKFAGARQVLTRQEAAVAFS